MRHSESGVNLNEILNIYPSENDIPDTIRGEHLEKSQEQRLKIRVYDTTKPQEYLKMALAEGNSDIFAEASVANFNDFPDFVLAEGMLGGTSYVISKVDSSPKRSHDYRNCTGLAVVAESKNGEQISFLSHQNPTDFLNIHREQFRSDLEKALNELMQKAKKGTIDAVIIGGDYGSERVKNSNVDLVLSDQYKQSIHFINTAVKEISERFGVDIPVTVVSGPNYARSARWLCETDVLLDTQARLLFASKPSQAFELANSVYTADDINSYAAAFDENKNNFSRLNYEYQYMRLFKEAAERARKFRMGQSNNRDFVPVFERAIYDRVKKLGLPTFARFSRTNEDDITEFSYSFDRVRSSKELVINSERVKIMYNKIEGIANFAPFVDKVLADMVMLSKNSLKIMNGEFTLPFIWDKKTSELDYVVGGEQGFWLIEEAPDFSEAVLQNFASFFKALHIFLDDCVSPASRKKYVQIVIEKIKINLQKYISRERYSAIVGNI